MRVSDSIVEVHLVLRSLQFFDCLHDFLIALGFSFSQLAGEGVFGRDLLLEMITLGGIEIVIVIDQELESFLECFCVHCDRHAEEFPLSLIPLPDSDRELYRWHLSQVRFEEAHYLVKLNFFFTSKNGLKLAIKVDKAAIVRVLQPVLLNVLPKGGNDASPALLFDSQHCLQLVAHQIALRCDVRPEAQTDFDLYWLCIAAIFRCSWWEIPRYA